MANPRETPPDASAAAEPEAPSGAEAAAPGEPPAGPGELGRPPAEAIAPAAVRVPTRGNRRLEALLDGINADEEVRTWWHMAQVQSERLGMSDHSWVHVQVVLNVALRLLRLLVKGGLEPTMVSDHAMRQGAEHIHHVHPDGRAPGREELQAFGQPYEEFVVEGTSEDAAMLLAYEAGAKLVVAVGTHATMVEFLDKGRAGMSSTFLTRLRLGPMLVDAKGVARLYEGNVRKRDLGLLVLAAFIAMVAIAVVSEPIHVFLEGVWLWLRDLWFSITGSD